MVKGVNKQIIEINDTGNKYFEKVLLFVAPGKKDLPCELLHAKAKEYVMEFSGGGCQTLSLREAVKKKKTRKTVAFISVGVLAAAVITALIINIL
ncbi:MAG: hypothetical protein IIW94_02060 [Clostridia bacterium]|nr:hypothetical protein [Clostridia bacterium]